MELVLPEIGPQKELRLLGIKAVIVESFERIHRSNLIGMGVLPIQLKDGITIENLGFKW